jgi:hypothetical protein
MNPTIPSLAMQVLRSVPTARCQGILGHQIEMPVYRSLKNIKGLEQPKQTRQSAPKVAS